MDYIYVTAMATGLLLAFIFVCLEISVAISCAKSARTGDAILDHNKSTFKFFRTQEMQNCQEIEKLASTQKALCKAYDGFHKSIEELREQNLELFSILKEAGQGKLEPQQVVSRIDALNILPKDIVFDHISDEDIIE